MKTQNAARILGAVVLLSLASCSAERFEAPAAESAIATDTIGTAAVTPGAAVVPDLNSPERKLIRTARLEAEVADLYAAAARIERGTLQLGGQVRNSTIRKELLDTRTERSGSDSLTTYRRYQGHAHVVLRVPVSNLDTLLRLIAAESAFIASRQINIDDATSRYLANELRSRNSGAAGRDLPRIAPEQGLEARQYIDSRSDQSIDRQVANFETLDATAFATLEIDLTQPEELVLGTQPDHERAMQPGAGRRMLQALQGGWDILYTLLLALIRIWPLILLLALAAVAARRWHRRTRPGSFKS